MNVLNYSLVFLGVALIFSSCNSATGNGRGQGRGKQRGEERFEKEDLDGDGKLSYSEFQQRPMANQAGDSQAAFSKIDSNGDGFLTKTELRAARGAGRPPKQN